MRTGIQASILPDPSLDTHSSYSTVMMGWGEAIHVFGIYDKDSKAKWE